MTAAEWIARSRPEAPARLVQRVREVLDAHPAWARRSVPEALLEAADVLLKVVLRDGDDAKRDRALDLLAADACVTWAFEAAADDPDSLSARARATMQRLDQVIT